MRQGQRVAVLTCAFASGLLLGGAAYGDNIQGYTKDAKLNAIAKVKVEVKCTSTGALLGSGKSGTDGFFSVVVDIQSCGMGTQTAYVEFTRYATSPWEEKVTGVPVNPNALGDVIIPAAGTQHTDVYKTTVVLEAR
jgi:hypothetical protein